ncbi:WD40 repeat-like protein [Guyanagaster necrorhizus]|uniref:ASTRA-associated protein 1 n=1 Tax=Guyanagaster necrorhizus TaxID=856835 RepID=A0A9P7VGX2_9AGAR|nr:WD40 repeat-like protein [Guyanagaster necrorhizus MCA 3950]KAG7440806.1 WD40 repeat-like protein [Guyanagaster necrorhizus MCA 3950]
MSEPSSPPLPPPPPRHILRSHSSGVTALFISLDNERVYSGDGSGFVVSTSTRTLRAISSWKAHDDGILGVQEWGANIITQGRDNKLHVWRRVEELPGIGGSAALSESPVPVFQYSMDVNALNYCRFSLMLLLLDDSQTGSSSKDQLGDAFIALPNLVESSEADIWCLPSCTRVHAAIGKQESCGSILSTDGRGNQATGIIMSLHLFEHDGTLRILIAYESGNVTLREFVKSDRTTSVEGLGWKVLWKAKLHAEAIMAMSVTNDNSMALTVSADHLIGRYDLLSFVAKTHRTNHPGNGAVTIRDDGRVCAVGGWDGQIRLYSTKSFKPLGTLKYHKNGCRAIAFARSLSECQIDADDDEDGMSKQEREERSRWLIGGAKDKLVTIWSLIAFNKT